MKPLPLLLLLSSFLLCSHLRPVLSRPRSPPGWRDAPPGLLLPPQRPEQVFLRAPGDLLPALRLLQSRDPELLRLLPLEEEQEEQEEEEEEAMRRAEQLLKRSEEPPLSIDLTFHLLRNMIQMAKMESQREQAQLNRKVLDEVGK